MLASTRAAFSPAAVRFHTKNSSNSAPRPDTHNLPSQSPPPPPPPSRTPLLSVPKPSWIVRTEGGLTIPTHESFDDFIVSYNYANAFRKSNVRLEKRRKPDPSCVVCRGSGRVDCHDCCGKGRTNNVDLAMLPNGEWPKWCKTCGGSGLAYCSRCLGTGEYRYLMGFHFMKKDGEGAREQENYKVRDLLRARKSAEDLLPNDENEKYS